MSSDSPDGRGLSRVDGKTFDSVEFLLFDSLVHHLIEKGVLTKNDALSVIQTVAQVVQGQIHENDAANKGINTVLSMLERTYASFEALPARYGRSGLDGHNVFPLRTPLHGDRPRFPSDEP